MQMQSRIDIRQQHARQQDKRFALVKSRFQSQMQSRPKFVRQVAARSLNEHLVWNNKYIQELGASGEPLISSALKFPELCDIGSRMTAGDTVLAVLPKEPSRVERERERAAVGRSPAVAVPATEVQQCMMHCASKGLGSLTGRALLMSELAGLSASRALPLHLAPWLQSTRGC